MEKNDENKMEEQRKLEKVKEMKNKKWQEQRMG
jgi:hypothetical protein